MRLFFQRCFDTFWTSCPQNLYSETVSFIPQHMGVELVEGISTAEPTETSKMLIGLREATHGQHRDLSVSRGLTGIGKGNPWDLHFHLCLTEVPPKQTIQAFFHELLTHLFHSQMLFFSFKALELIFFFEPLAFSIGIFSQIPIWIFPPSLCLTADYSLLLDCSSCRNAVLKWCWELVVKQLLK